MIKKYWKDLISMAVLMAFSLVLRFWMIPAQVAVATWDTGTSFNSRTLPYLLSNILFLTSLLGILNALAGLLKQRRQAQATEAGTAKSGSRKAGIMTLVVGILVIAYYFLYLAAGFLIATAVIAPLVMLVLESKKWTYLLCLYVFGAVIFVVFRYVLLIPIT